MPTGDEAAGQDESDASVKDAPELALDFRKRLAAETAEGASRAADNPTLPRGTMTGDSASDGESREASPGEPGATATAEAADDADVEPAPRETPSARREAAARTYEVKAGDTLSSIATKHYGHEKYWVDIARANPTLDPARLRVGQELRLPARERVEQRVSRDDGAATPTPPGVLKHTVRPGETLSTIAKRHYGDSSRWRVIFNANRDKIGNDPNRLGAGDELKIPPVVRD